MGVYTYLSSIVLGAAMFAFLARIFFSAVLALSLFVHGAHASDIEILSKNDAVRMFKFSREEWNASVREAVTRGLAKATRSSDGTFTQYIMGDGWILGAIPLYDEGNDRVPFALQVSTAYRPSHFMTTLIDQDAKASADVCQRARKQMLPEFSVECALERAGGGVMFIFTIRKAGSK
jgi:hypothetical protein